MEMSVAGSAMPSAYGRGRSAALLALAIGISAIVGGAFLAMVYGVAPLTSALSHANAVFLAMAAALGIIIQGVRANRAAGLLSVQRQAQVGDTYHAMVVGHGIGGLVPVAPCALALRCFLTERLSSVAVAFSAGVFMLEGVLDGLGPAILTGFLLLALHPPTWIRVLLVITLVQSVLSFTAPFIVHTLRRRTRNRSLPGWITRSIAWGGEVADGLASVLSQDRRGHLSVLGVSFLITALSGLQLVLFLAAFGLTASAGNVLLILVLTLAAGNLPINLPGFGTVTTAAALQVAGIHGAGVAGFVLVSRAMLSSETTLLACTSLAWWSATGKLRDLRVGAALSSLYRVRCQAAVCRVRSIGRVASVPRRALAALRTWPRALTVAVGLFGIVALSRPVSSSSIGHDSVFASLPAEHQPTVATTAGDTHRAADQDTLRSHSSGYRVPSGRGAPDFAGDTHSGEHARRVTAPDLQTH